MRIRPVPCGLFLLLCFGACSLSLAQSKQFTVELITRDDGMPVSVIYDIHEDRRGFLWLGADRGLVRFDGVHFDLYRHISGDSTSLAGFDVKSIQEDADGNLWLGTSEGLSFFDRKLDRFENFSHSPPIAIAYSIHHPEYVWSGSNDGLSRLYIPSHTFETLVPSPNRSKFVPGFRLNSGRHGLEVDRSGTVWAGMGWGIRRYDTGIDSFITYLHDPRFPTFNSNEWPRNRFNSVGSILPLSEPDSIIWFGGRNGLTKFDLKDESFETHYPWPIEINPDDNLPQSQHVAALHWGQSGTLWVGERRGIFTFDTESQQFTLVHRQDGWPSVILEDRSGTAWIGYGNGILTESGLRKIQVTDNPFTIYGTDDTGPNFRYSAGITEDAAGNVIIMSAEGLIGVDPLSGSTSVLYKPSPVGGQSLGIEEGRSPETALVDRRGYIWIAGANTLAGYDPETKSIERFSFDRDQEGEDAPLRGDIQKILEDEEGFIWIASYFDGVSRFDPEKKTFTHYVHDPDDKYSLHDNRVYQLYLPPSTPRKLWVGTEVGPSRLDLDNNTFSNYYDGATGAVYAFLEDSRERFWIASSKGLHLFDRKQGTYTTFTDADGLAHNQTRSVLEDDQGYLWISTQDGLSRFDPETRTFKTYTTRDGLPGNGFTQEGVFKSSSGALFYIAGPPFNWFSFIPNQLIDRSDPPSIELTGFDISGTPVEVGPESPLRQSVVYSQSVTLTHAQNELTFHYTGLGSKYPEDILFQYRMEGYDDDWVNAQTQRFVRYNQMPPGDFRWDGSASAQAPSAQGARTDSRARVGESSRNRDYECTAESPKGTTRKTGQAAPGA